MAVALLMAGGTSSRMRVSGIDTPKPLVRVCGATMLEWNLYALLRAGIEEVVVATSARQPDVTDFVRGLPSATARAASVALHVVEETEPLGNIGGARLLQDFASDVLVVYADNLTTLDLTSLVDHHGSSGAAYTIALHDEPIRLPYGEVRLSGGLVTSYDEKPVRVSRICSGIAVLAPRALAAIEVGRPVGLVDLFHELRARGETVAGFPHSAAWIDVNDATLIERAEALVRANRDAFCTWLGAAGPVVDCVLAERNGDVLVESVSEEWISLPRTDGQFRDEAAYVLDAFDPVRAENVRHRVHVTTADTGGDGTRRTWIRRADARERPDATPALRRAVGLARPG